MYRYVCTALLGCALLACSKEQPRTSYDQSKSPRTGAFQTRGYQEAEREAAEEEQGLQPASREEREAGEPEYYGQEIPEPRDPLAEPETQGMSVMDQRTTQAIRQALERDDTLSNEGKNVKVITLNGRVTLRGAVRDITESQRIEAHAKQVAGVENVDNQLEIRPNYQE